MRFTAYIYQTLALAALPDTAAAADAGARRRSYSERSVSQSVSLWERDRDNNQGMDHKSTTDCVHSMLSIIWRSRAGQLGTVASAKNRRIDDSREHQN